MILLTLFAAESADSASGFGALGVDAGAFIIQLITFFFVFLLLRKFAFAPISRKLEERRKTIDDGIRLGQKMEAKQAKFEEEIAQVIRDARHEADRIIGDGQKEAREIVREAEKVGQRKVDTMIDDAEARIKEESHQAKRRLEKEISGLVSEATEAVVGEKVDSTKDAAIIDKALKGQQAK